ncbi:hypothetical protein LQR18_25950 (plasmid) [Escherichia coli]|nr:hypothetical protein LQR18_25950 [Escherichia coli]
MVSSATADDNKRVVGIVNESGEVYMSGLSEKRTTGCEMEQSWKL